MSDNELKLKVSLDKKKEKKEPKDDVVESKHTITIDGKEIAYTARTGTMILREEEDEKGLKPMASIFFISYTKDGEEPESRPITFAYNGGPGSSSVWLHMGVYGPYRCISEENEKPVAPPYKLVENQYSLLDKTDFVFIDPVSTGYSRAVEGEKASQFHGIKKDIESVGEFIRMYTSKYKRWSSPKFLSGESYGTTRSAGLSGYLQDNYGMYLNGIVLVSSILNFQTAYFVTGNDLPFILFLPTYTATSWYHKQLSKELLDKELPDLLKEVEDFALNEYTLAMMKGDALSDNEKEEINKKLVYYTGLSSEYIDGTDLRINIHKYVKELLRSSKRTVGRLDSRFIGIDRDSTGMNYEYDPSMAAIQGPYTATFNDYVRRKLNYENKLPYAILAGLYMNWDYKEYQNRFVEVGETLRSAMSKNQNLKVHIANGYFDFATPYFATEYTFSHLGLDPSLKKNISMSYYEAGHMMYLHEPSLKKLREEVIKFIDSAL